MGSATKDVFAVVRKGLAWFQLRVLNPRSSLTRFCNHERVDCRMRMRSQVCIYVAEPD